MSPTQAAPHDCVSSRRPSAPGEPNACALATRPVRVLVVDDNRDIHDDFRKVLAPKRTPDDLVAFEHQLLGTVPSPRQRLARFELDSALQGVEGVDCVRKALGEKRPYALAFVDMRMPPGQDGLRTVVDMWAVDPRLQVVICSAHSDYSWSQIVETTGETDRLVILRKPFEPIEVLQLAHALTKKWEVQNAVERQVDDLEALVAERTREVEQRQALFQLILENATDLIAVVDAHGRRIYNSPSYEKVLGFRPDELQATHAFTQIHPDDVAAVNAAVEAAATKGRGELVVYRMRHRDGTWRTLESCAGVVSDPRGELAYLVIVARDITQRREMELKQQLGQKLESIGRLAAGIAHEINTPTQYLTDNTRFLGDAFRSLVAFVQPGRAPALQPGTTANASGAGDAKAPDAENDIDFLIREVPQAIQQNLEGLARISRIVGSLKEFSHPNSAQKSSVDLNHAIETAVTVSRHEWKYVAEVATEFDPALPPVPCIADEINQVILNLLVNAAQTIADALKTRGEPRGRITVRTRRDDDRVALEVADTGMGIPLEIRHKIFEPFFTTKGAGKGTGQGLAIVHAIVTQHHGGTVDFVSEVGHGTTFRVMLPLSPLPTTSA